MNAAQKKHVAVIGAGVAGLTAADALAGWGARVSLIEATPFLGGHALQLTCKATDACVKCGACVADDKFQRAVGRADVAIFTGTQIESLGGRSPFEMRLQTHPPRVDAERCDRCGICLRECPAPGAMLQGRTQQPGLTLAIHRDRCRYFADGGCTRCRDVCPKEAIDLSAGEQPDSITADALLVTTGFSTFDPVDKPFGYGLYPNVITSLEAERRLGQHALLKRPSDGRPADRIAFIQCVGSRDARLGHDWCSKICCGSSLRMARLIQSRQPSVAITFFYIDVQTFGSDFHIVYRQVRESITMVRAIPGEIVRTAADDLQLVYFDPQIRQLREETVDVVVLSVGLLPAAGGQRLSRALGLPTTGSGFMPAHGAPDGRVPAGIFTAGAALGPMTIAESVASAEKAVGDVVDYLGLAGCRQPAPQPPSNPD